jgi:hypothetical protein
MPRTTRLPSDTVQKGVPEVMELSSDDDEPTSIVESRVKVKIEPGSTCLHLDNGQLTHFPAVDANASLSRREVLEDLFSDDEGEPISVALSNVTDQSISDGGRIISSSATNDSDGDVDIDTTRSSSPSEYFDAESDIDMGFEESLSDLGDPRK